MPPEAVIHDLERRPAESSANDALERRLAHLRFDLHDGPQQQVHLLAEDVRSLREQLGPMIEDHPDRDRALGRLDDLGAQLAALDTELRRLSAAAIGRSSLAEESLAAGLAELVDAFRARTGIAPWMEISGDADALTDSQRLTVSSIVREALSNIRRHSGAEHVEITLDAGEEAIRVEVRDDGRGFDPVVEAPAAARAGRLGLVGMRERTRMLGGWAEIRSARGGPTVVSASVPRRPPDRA